MSRKTDATGIPVDELEELKRQREMDEEREAEEEFMALIREQRRYEIARDCMASMVVYAIPDQKLIDGALKLMERETASHAEIFAEAAVAYADALLDRLEKE